MPTQIIISGTSGVFLKKSFESSSLAVGAFVHPLGKAQAHQGSVVLGQGQIPAAFFGDPVCVGVQKLVEPLLRKDPLLP